MLKKVVIAMMGFVVILSTASSSYALKRYVLAELFTNVGCPPCRGADSTLDTISIDWGDSLVIIRYHVWWPGYDPMYYHNPSENATRNNYYGNNYTPHLFIDGYIDASYVTSWWRTRISGEFSNPAFVTLSLEGVFDTVAMKGRVISTFQVVEDTFPSNTQLKLRYASVQNNIFYIGANGWPNHDEAFLDMFPTTAGVNLGRPDSGVTIVDTQVFTLDPFVSSQHPIWYWEDFEVVAFLQDDVTKKVYQAAKEELMNFSIFICGDANGDGSVTSADMIYIANYLYSSGPPPDPEVGADFNGDGLISFLDLTWAANYFFQGGPGPVCLGE